MDAIYDPETADAIARARLISSALPYMLRYEDRASSSNMAATPWATPSSPRPSPATSRCSRRPASTRSSCMAAGRRSARCWSGWASSREFHGGLRVTDQATVEVVEMVLAGSINKEIVWLINAEGEWAIGLSRQGRQHGVRREGDAGPRSTPTPTSSEVLDLGFVGEPIEGRPHAARLLLGAGDDPGDRAGRAGPRRPDLQHQRRHLRRRHRRRAWRRAPAVPHRCRPACSTRTSS